MKSENKMLVHLREVARLSYGDDWGNWAYNNWESFNKRFWGGKLIPGVIEIGLTPHGRNLGSYSPKYNKITLHESLIDPSTRAPWDIPADILRKRDIGADVILHEMIHQYLHQFHGDEYRKQDSHNCNLWCDEVNRLSKELNLNCSPAAPEKVRWVNGKAKRKVPDGHLTRKQLSTWPHSVKTYK